MNLLERAHRLQHDAERSRLAPSRRSRLRPSPVCRTGSPCSRLAGCVGEVADAHTGDVGQRPGGRLRQAAGSAVRREPVRRRPPSVRPCSDTRQLSVGQSHIVGHWCRMRSSAAPRVCRDVARPGHLPTPTPQAGRFRISRLNSSNSAVRISNCEATSVISRRSQHAASSCTPAPPPWPSPADAARQNHPVPSRRLRAEASSATPQPLAITMWRFLRRPSAACSAARDEDWNVALDELASRGYDAVITDPVPAPCGHQSRPASGTVPPRWNQQDWGAPALVRVQARYRP